MRNYLVPPDMREREKLIGGVIDLAQFFWLLGGLILGSVFFVLTFPLFGKLSMIFLLIGLLIGTPFAFYKKHDLTLVEYIIRKKNFDKKTKILINVRHNTL